MDKEHGKFDLRSILPNRTCKHRFKFIFKKIENDISICKIILQISKIIKKIKLKKIFEF